MNNYPENRVMNPGHTFISEKSQQLGDEAFLLAQSSLVTPKKNDQLCLIRISLLIEAATKRKKLSTFVPGRALEFGAMQRDQTITLTGKQAAAAAYKRLKLLVAA